MIEPKWHAIDNNKNINAHGRSISEGTWAMNVPGGLIVKTCRVDSLFDHGATSSSSMTFVPGAYLVVRDGKTLLGDLAETLP